MVRIPHRSSWMTACFVMVSFLLGILLTTGFSVNKGQPAMRELEQMQSDLKSASRILTAQMDRVVFLDRSGRREEFAFFGTNLWRNSQPVVSNIQAFHFEYRDCGGNLLKISDIDLSSIRSVSFILRARHTMFANTTVRIQPVAGRNREPAQVSWASLTED